MSLYETLYGKRCRTPLCWQEIDDALTIKAELIQATTKVLSDLREEEGSLDSSEKLHK